MAILRRTERAMYGGLMLCFEKERYDLSDVWCKAVRSKKQQGVDGHVGHKRVFR